LSMTSLSLRDIRLKPALLKAVERKARDAGTTAPEYLRALIERALLAEQSFDEILRPVRKDFASSGISPDQLDQIVERARGAAHARSRARKAGRTRR
jgi:hypothetical protein